MIKRNEPVFFRFFAIERGFQLPSFFANFFLPHHSRLPFAHFHRELFELHETLRDEDHPQRRGRRLAIAAPRGSAKTTIQSLILTLHDIVYEIEPYIIIISATEHQARMRLAALRKELQPATLIADGFRLQPIRANARSLFIGDTRVDAYGANTEIRGLSHATGRPTPISLAAAESSNIAQSPRRRQRMLQWFNDIVEHLGDTYTHIIVIGTILHPESLLAQLLHRPDFHGQIHRSIMQFAPPSALWDQWRHLLTDPSNPDRRQAARQFFEQNRKTMELGTTVLWRQHEDYETLNAQLIIQGRRAFFQEKQNEPLTAKYALFDPESAWTARIHNNEAILKPHGNDERQDRPITLTTARRFGFLDSALGKSAAENLGDFAAFATVLLLPGNVLLLSDIWIHRATPSQQIEIIISRHAQDPYERIGVESNGFQELVARRLEEVAHQRVHAIPIEHVNPKRSKQTRIATIEPLLASGRLILHENLPEEFWREITTYPNSAHDDALDAAAGAIDLALKAARSQEPIKIAHRGRRSSAY